MILIYAFFHSMHDNFIKHLLVIDLPSCRCRRVGCGSSQLLEF